MSRTLLRCHGCRISVLDTFAALAGVSIPFRSLQPFVQPPRPQCRQLSNTASHHSQSTESPDLKIPDNNVRISRPETLPSQPSSSTSSLPWYLQVGIPSPPAHTSPLLALQEIPPVPSDAPPILSAMLSHLSISIGLDNLALLDLRHLQPPPALGANLLMIIGTARSVKHLNVSADRFCRWCRSTYKLRPYADGLLGRNELKLKLRRRARKMKLAQSVGNAVVMQGSGVDDGITTGWICVNVGSVEDAVYDKAESSQPKTQPQPQREVEEQDEEALDHEEEYDNPEYVGFGSQSMAPRIVVQMFTEEKRLEMDLEGLWDFRNTRRAQKVEKADVLAQEAVRERETWDADGAGDRRP